MISFPNAKINIGLRILGKREDGYHNIETVYYPLRGIIYDSLEIIRSSKFVIHSAGLKIQGQKRKNLCVRAYELLKKDFSLSNVGIYLYKAIPMGAGLGGGSADGAFMLKLLNHEFNLGISDKKLSEYAVCLGSDCPFFIFNQPAYATGKGEIIKPLREIEQLKTKHIVVVYPEIQVRTADAYKEVDKQPENKKRKMLKLSELVYQPISEWKRNIVNDFEEVIFLKYPILRKIKRQLYDYGAVYASMSGSGSAIYGVFEQKPALTNLFKEYKVWQGQL